MMEGVAQFGVTGDEFAEAIRRNLRMLGYDPEPCDTCGRVPYVEWVDTSSYGQESRVPGRLTCMTAGCVYRRRPSPTELERAGATALARVRAVWDEVFA